MEEIKRLSPTEEINLGKKILKGIENKIIKLLNKASPNKLNELIEDYKNKRLELQKKVWINDNGEWILVFSGLFLETVKISEISASDIDKYALHYTIGKEIE